MRVLRSSCGCVAVAVGSWTDRFRAASNRATAAVKPWRREEVCSVAAVAVQRRQWRRVASLRATAVSKSQRCRKLLPGAHNQMQHNITELDGSSQI